jgi:hypothetical protein
MDVRVSTSIQLLYYNKYCCKDAPQSLYTPLLKRVVPNGGPGPPAPHHWLLHSWCDCKLLVSPCLTGSLLVWLQTPVLTLSDWLTPGVTANSWSHLVWLAHSWSDCKLLVSPCLTGSLLVWLQTPGLTLSDWLTPGLTANSCSHLVWLAHSWSDCKLLVATAYLLVWVNLLK